MASNRVQVTQTVAANLKVDPSAVTSPVSVVSLPLPTGAATSALQAGGLPAALGAGGGLKVDGSGTALPVSGTVTANAGTNLNTSALATAAKQPALGTAGTPSADVITVQGVASGTPQPVLEQAPPTTANGQVNVTNSAATLVAQRLTRKQLTIVNRQAAPIFVGIATVTTANGFQIDPGASLTLYTTALIQAITAAASGASEKTHYIETY